MSKWVRFPAPIESEEDRRQLAGILTAAGMEVRVFRTRVSSRAAYNRFVEYRMGPEPVTERKDG